LTNQNQACHGETREIINSSKLGNKVHMHVAKTKFMGLPETLETQENGANELIKPAN
jgi:hypothetical protein